MKGIVLLAGCVVSVVGGVWAEDGEERRKFRWKEVYRAGEKVLFETDFAERGLDLLAISKDDQYAQPKADPKRMEIVAAPGLREGMKAVRFVVPRKPNSFRSEISLPHEPGFQERWYGITQYVPKTWEIDENRASDIVMQWHAIPGKGKSTNPNLNIAIQGERWLVHQAVGDALTKPTRSTVVLPVPMERGTWSNWIVHVKWSPKDDGQIEIWKDGESVFRKEGPNAYGTIGVEYTPYLKTGIYRPEWYLKTEERRRRFEAEEDPVSGKEVLVAKVVVASEEFSLEEMKGELPAVGGE